MPATLLPPRQYDHPPPMPVIEHVLNYQTLQVWGSMFPDESLLLFIKDKKRCGAGLWDGLFGGRKGPGVYSSVPSTGTNGRAASSCGGWHHTLVTWHGADAWYLCDSCLRWETAGLGAPASRGERPRVLNLPNHLNYRG
jgi:hypothetical protein